MSGPDAFEQIEQWIQRCRRSCKSCAQSRHDAKPPHRVLDLCPPAQAEDDLALTQGFEACKDDYLTLSYCWSEPFQPQASTSGNNTARIRGFSSTTLPQTIRDAIEITRRLGFRYLWVDSMCILQDSPVDERMEIRKMRSISESSFLTIFPGSTASVSSGFLTTRHALPVMTAGKVPFSSSSN